MRGLSRAPASMRPTVQSYFDRQAVGADQAGPNSTASRQLIRRLLADCVRGQMLELGCGFDLSAESETEKRLVAFDLSLGSLRRLCGAEARVCGDAARLPFASNTFDTVVCVHLIHHLVGRGVKESDAVLQGTLAEVSRVLSPEGGLVIVDTMILGGPLYRLERRCFPLVSLVVRALGAVPVLFRNAEAVTTALAKAGFLEGGIRVLPALGKALTPWGGPLRWPMGLSPLRDVMLVAQRGRAGEGNPLTPLRQDARQPL